MDFVVQLWHDVSFERGERPDAHDHLGFRLDADLMAAITKPSNLSLTFATLTLKPRVPLVTRGSCYRAWFSLSKESVAAFSLVFFAAHRPISVA